MRKCLCGQGSDHVLGDKDGRTVVKCSCGLIRTANPPEDYLTLYTEGTEYHENRRGEHFQSNPNYKERFNHDYGVAQQRWGRFFQQWRSLDVGSANGGFVAMVNDQGVNSEGLELNPTMAAWSQRITGRKIHTSWDHIFGLFDLITYNDVIEHIQDPIVELAMARTRLHLGGWLIVDTPDTQDRRFTELGLAWHHMKPKEHLWFFNEATLRDVLVKAGFKVRGVDRPLQGKLVLYAQNQEA